MERGLELDDKLLSHESVRVVKCENSSCLLEIILKEGRNRQIRRMSEMFGDGVIDLKRITISSVKLNGLREEEWRHLTDYELSSLYK